MTECDSIDRAASLFESALQTVAGLMSITASAEAGDIRFHLIYEEAAEGAKGEVVAYGSGDPSQLKLRKVLWTTLSPLFVFISNADESTRRRLNTTFRWFGRGVEEGDPIDRFTAFWVALETLNVLLERKWGITSMERSCPHCAGSLGKHHGLYGVERLLRSIPEGGLDTERRVRKLRNGILHGFMDLNTIAGEAGKLSNTLACAVLRGIAQVCGWDEEKEKWFVCSPLPAPPPFQVQARFTYERTGQQLGFPGYHPIVEIDWQEDVNHDERGEPSGVSYSAQVRVAAEGMTAQEESLACWVATRVGGPLPIQVATIESSNAAAREEQGQQPKKQLPKGVTLWAIGDDEVWYPDPHTIGARGERI